MVICGQVYKNVGIRRSHWRRIAIRKINAAVGQAYIVNDALDFGCWNLLSNRAFDQITEVGGLLNAHSSGSTHVEFESAAVYAGEEVPAQPGNQNCQRGNAAHEERSQENTPVLETALQQPTIEMTKSLEGCLKTLLKSDQRIGAGCTSDVLLISPQQVLGHGRNDGP